MFPLKVAAVFVLLTRLTVWTVNLCLFQTWGKGGRGLGWDAGLGGPFEHTPMGLHVVAVLFLIPRA